MRGKTGREGERERDRTRERPLRQDADAKRSCSFFLNFKFDSKLGVLNTSAARAHVAGAPAVSYIGWPWMFLGTGAGLGVGRAIASLAL